MQVGLWEMSWAVLCFLGALTTSSLILLLFSWRQVGELSLRSASVAVSSKYLKYVVTGEGLTQSLVQRMNRKRPRTLPCGAPVLLVMMEEFASFCDRSFGAVRHIINNVTWGHQGLDTSDTLTQRSSQGRLDPDLCLSSTLSHSHLELNIFVSKDNVQVEGYKCQVSLSPYLVFCVVCVLQNT